MTIPNASAQREYLAYRDADDRRGRVQREENDRTCSSATGGECESHDVQPIREIMGNYRQRHDDPYLPTRLEAEADGEAVQHAVKDQASRR